MDSIVNSLSVLVVMSILSLSALSQELQCNNQASKRTVNKVQEAVLTEGMGKDRIEAERDAIEQAILKSVYSTYRCRSCTVGLNPECEQFVKTYRWRGGHGTQDPDTVVVHTESADFDGKCFETEDGDGEKTGNWKCIGTVSLVTIDGAPLPSAEVGCSCKEPDIEPLALSEGTQSNYIARSCNTETFQSTLPLQMETQEQVTLRASGDIGDFADTESRKLKCGQETEWQPVTVNQQIEYENGAPSVIWAKRWILREAIEEAANRELPKITCDSTDCPKRSVGCFQEGYLLVDNGGLTFDGECTYDPENDEMPYTCKGRAVLSEGNSKPTVQGVCDECR